MFQNELQELGLTEGEAKVFEALLGLGASTVGPIVKKSGVAYSNVYEILQRLIDKGLASFITRQKTKYFQAVEPTRIREYLEKQEREIHRSKQLLETMLPKLQQVKAFAGKREETEIFEGEKGLLTAYESLIQGGKKGDVAQFLYVHDPAYYAMAERFYPKLWQLLKQSPVVWQGVVDAGFPKTKLAKKMPRFIQQRAVSFPIPANVDIFQERVLITSWGQKPIGILIHSREIAQNFQTYFQALQKKTSIT